MRRRSSRYIAEAGEQIYAKKFRSYERENTGKYLAIDVDNERAYLADTPEEALKSAQRMNPEGSFHLVRIGFEGLYRVASQSYGGRILRR